MKDTYNPNKFTVPFYVFSIYFHIVQQVLEFLCNPDDESRHEERQQALLELSHAGGLQQVDEEKFLYWVERAKL